MSNTKRYAADAGIDIENFPDLGPGDLYPGEREAAEKAYELTKYSDAELHAEIARRVFAPSQRILEQAIADMDARRGITEDQPF